jgi:hypothetical protein
MYGRRRDCDGESECGKRHEWGEKGRVRHSNARSAFI